MVYLNTITGYGVETVDELDRNDFPTFREFKAELKRLIFEYRLAGINVYRSQRSTNEWRH